MKISENFFEYEIICHCGCGQDYVVPELYDMAESFRIIVGSPIAVHCVNRCVEKNNEVGGSKHSYHLTGAAMDCHATKLVIEKLHEIAKAHHAEDSVLYGGLGIYSWGIHIDIGPFRGWNE